VTGSYSVVVKRDAEKELRRVPRGDLTRIVTKIAALASEPRPPGSVKLSTLERYRIRQGDWRIVYAVDDGARCVTVFKIGHRSEVYRQLVAR
jgi:mRNA interferase RelE/StbE